MEVITKFLGDTGFAMLSADPKVLIMIAISFVLLYLAIVKQFEPLLLLPIAFGMLLTNLPGAEMYHSNIFAAGNIQWSAFPHGIINIYDNAGAIIGTQDITAGLIDYLYLGVKRF